MPTSIHTIEISNFKSFPGRTIIRPIPPFTAIIGPNGSGKSNIIDAISFALGEKPSALRVGRLSELIHRGIGTPTPVGVPIKNITYVKVVFNVDGGIRKSFTRKIYGKDCQYIIDDEDVTKVFYMSKLREMGLDINAENFLIPQGYIECFVAKDLTAMFEKTSNSIMYKAEYDRLKLKLSKAQEEVNFQQQMKKLILTQKKDAIIEKAQTDTYLELKKEYNKTKLEFQLIRLLLIKKESDSLQDEKREIKLQIDKHLSNKGAVVLLLQCTKPQCQSLRSSLEDITKDILEKENIIQQRKVEYVSIEDTISLWQKRRDHARVSLDSASKAYDAKKRTIQELKDELKQINNRLTELKKQPQISMAELSNSQVKRYEELRNEAGYRAAKFVEQINSLMCAQEKDRDKLDNENRRKQELENKVKLISLRKENLETRLTKLHHLNAESKATLVEKTAKMQGLNQKITEISNESSSLTNDIAKITQELSQANTDNNMILQQIEKNETIKMFKQLCSGVYGRLSDLCKPIHPRYNVAITKVFGKNMDAIVVDTRHTGYKCIQFLKERKISVETFLPLDSIKSIFLKEQLR
ncbi:PREDICTED: structural maintenance of chromosomes protein 1A-like [Vollenhovia emeryi]|uniref:structural maintenance of chromosomes protein 1A-like n=1 Tax=Vollenhovia emeryi TaxID=411798 RepID=UPI0005F4460A|nr:PREDICTED: structural maintenance of chromosomes protein 1A-like [Vollenhovia emeryi]